jgi:hypothetical protein
MLSTLAITVLWWSLYFLLYGIAKKLVNTATERQQIEIFSSPFCFIPNKRKPKKKETVYFVIGLLTIPFTAFFLFKGFTILQTQLFRNTNDILISSAQWFIPSIFIALVISGIFLIIGSKKGFTANENWKKQPSFNNVTLLKRKYKLVLKWLNLIAFVSLLAGMFNFLKIHSQGITVNSLFLKKGKDIPFDMVGRAFIYMKEASQHSSRSSNKTIYKPQFDLILQDKSSISLLNNSFHTNQKHLLLKKTLLRLSENKIPIEIKKIAIYKNSLYRDFFQEERYEQIIDLFSYAQTIKEKRHEAIQKGKSYELDQIIYRIDSTSTDYGEGFYTPTKGSRFEKVYLTIQNNSRDTFIFVRMQLNVIDKNNYEYPTSLWSKEPLDESFNSYIPPSKTHSGYVSFQVPDSSRQLKMRYKEGFIDRKVIYFDLE